MLLSCIFLTDVYDKRLIFRIEMNLVSGYFRDVNLLPANFKENTIHLPFIHECHVID